VLARQVDRVVGEPEGDFCNRKVGVGDRLGENGMSVAVFATEGRGVAGQINGEFPNLKFFADNSLFASLRESDFVEKPASAAVLGDMLRPIGEQNLTVCPVAIPMLGAGELVED